MNDITALACILATCTASRSSCPDEDKALLARVREFAETEVAPSASAWWEAAEFPFDLIPKFAALDIAGLPYDWPDDGREPARRLGFLAMELARVDPSMTASSASTTGWRWAIHARAARRSSGSAGSPRWRGWRRSARSGSPSRTAAPTSRAACAPPRGATATSGCSTARSAGSATARSPTSSSSGRATSTTTRSRGSSSTRTTPASRRRRSRASWRCARAERRHRAHRLPRARRRPLAGGNTSRTPTRS